MKSMLSFLWVNSDTCIADMKFEDAEQGDGGERCCYEPLESLDGEGGGRALGRW